MPNYPKKDPQTIERVVNFLKDSSNFYGSSVKDRIAADDMYSGNFWTPELKKEWKRGNRRCEHLSQWGVFESAISSPLTSSPWHAQLEDQDAYTKIQDSINEIEADSDAKVAFQEAFAKGIDIGADFIVVSTVQDEFTGEPKIVPEVIEDTAAVALDPTVVKASARDAEQGAVVNWISTQKAKRLYGRDVVPMSYPSVLPKCFDIGDQWKKRPVNSIPIVTYYEKNDRGFVDMIKVCGDLVVQKVELPTTLVPIFRFAGYKVRKNQITDYIGIVRKTYSLQLGLNLAYSTMLDRIGRSPKANFMYPAGSLDGLEAYLERCCEDDALAMIYNPVAAGNGSAVPIQLKEAFETGDLQNVINTTQQLMAAVLGVPPEGIQGVFGNMQGDRSATEVLMEASNRESNVSMLYAHSYEAMKAVWTCVIQMLNGGKLVKFSLQAGPDVITANMKRRQELQAIAGMLPPEYQPIIAKYFADTMSTDDAKMLSKDIVANLDPAIKLVADQELDAYAIHEIKQMKSIADEAMNALEQKNIEVEKLKQQVSSMMQELADNREDRALNFQKFQIEQANKVALDSARIDLDAAKAGMQNQVDTGKLQVEQQKVAMEAQDRLERTIDDNTRLMEDTYGSV